MGHIEVCASAPFNKARIKNMNVALSILEWRKSNSRLLLVV